ncbi:phospholipase A1 VesT1.02-like isoform X2 [Pectinophora gossypiella]|uniref:phospholipase A1 VesT1.02-like isoform X2 n=1 Tax=Pectinophora gossypiella TaxID=13191 RepID=UPI00214E74E8|nr:phospholipase A1 VesT1.02-like isoform X2 [Pectinophora gossypiella]
MTNSFHIELLYVCKVVFVVGLYAASLPHHDPGKFSFSSLLDSILPNKPFANAGTDKCETLKSIFGLTYEQMQEKNSTNFHEALDIDLITKTGNIKQNLTVNKRLSRLMADAKTIVILVHGFMESSDGLMVNGLSPGLLKQQNLKVLALDGRRLINLEYFRSSTYARFMGERLGAFLGDLIQNGQDPSKLVLIGHSLGAHIAGIAGKRVSQMTNQTVGRLIALDPAAPCFGNVGAGGRLAHSDAEYVMVVHTNSGMLGLSEPVIPTGTPTAVRHSPDATWRRAPTAAPGNSWLRPSSRPITFQLANAKIGRCSRTDCVPRTKWHSWG